MSNTPSLTPEETVTFAAKIQAFRASLTDKEQIALAGILTAARNSTREVAPYGLGDGPTSPEPGSSFGWVNNTMSLGLTGGMTGGLTGATVHDPSPGANLERR